MTQADSLMLETSTTSSEPILQFSPRKRRNTTFNFSGADSSRETASCYTLWFNLPESCSFENVHLKIHRQSAAAEEVSQGPWTLTVYTINNENNEATQSVVEQMLLQGQQEEDLKAFSRTTLLPLDVDIVRIKAQLLEMSIPNCNVRINKKIEIDLPRTMAASK